MQEEEKGEGSVEEMAGDGYGGERAVQQEGEGDGVGRLAGKGEEGGGWAGSDAGEDDDDDEHEDDESERVTGDGAEDLHLPGENLKTLGGIPECLNPRP